LLIFFFFDFLAACHDTREIGIFDLEAATACLQLPISSPQGADWVGKISHKNRMEICEVALANFSVVDGRGGIET
jgi:hypothetical protein